MAFEIKSRTHKEQQIFSRRFKKKLTESSKMLEALKSRYITGFSASWRKARPFAAPSAIFILVDHGSDTEYPEIKNNILISTHIVKIYHK